ncbi:MAG: hypothetical protein ACLFUS_15770 [Candidatus Sumerlaeia bacterium]
MRSDPDFTHAQMTAAIEAGAQGFVLCREYEEISAATLKVVGDFQKRNLRT